ncbi:MAG: HAD family phosphatase [Saprospiraceae bacterium]|nr:HAD family phosphatase [Bacteroidia bacterium]NNE15854.1 HAD family phosphatase [Saprospiraceae bacterium]NNL92891.1 HAD family phosphatase [Saprospiraceae bacterium]
MKSRLKAIIFDCDGVLVDSEILSASVWSEMLQERGVQISPNEINEALQGGNIYTSIDYLEQFVKVSNRMAVETEYRKRSAIKFANELQPVKDIESLLKDINLPRCVASNGPLSKIKMNLKNTDLGKYFDADLLFSGYDYGFKPKPDLFLHACQAIGFLPNECLVIEDSLVGIQAAKAANIPSIYFNHQVETVDKENKIYGNMKDVRTYILSQINSM